MPVNDLNPRISTTPVKKISGIVKITRSKETFAENKLTSYSPKHREGILGSLRNFENFCMEKYGKPDIIDQLKEVDEDTLFENLQSWINWNSKLAPDSMNVYFSHVKKYLYYMGIKFTSEDVKNQLTFKHKVEENLYGLTVDNIQTIFRELSYFNKTLFTCQLSALMRIGELSQLRKKHLTLIERNIMVKIPTTIAKGKKARTTFFSKEASRMLRPRLRTLDDNDLVFGSSEKVENASANTRIALRRVLDDVGLGMRYESTKSYMINTHSFRAYGITKLSRHDENFAKLIAGQNGYLLQYDRNNDEELFKIYEQYESDLIIDDIEKLKVANAQLEDKDVKIQDMQAQIDSMSEMFRTVKELMKKNH